MSDVPSEAVAVLQSFLDASGRNDLAAMNSCVTRQTLQGGEVHGPPPGVRFVIGESHMEGATAVVVIRGYATDAPADAPPEIEMHCLLVREDGQWKFDLPATMQRMMGPQLDAAMQQIGEGLGQAVEMVGQAISTALGGDGGAPPALPAWDHVSLTPQADELFPLANLSRLPKTTLRVTYAIGTDVPVELDLGDALSHIPPDQVTDMLNQVINWFDNSLFAEWQAMFTGIIESGVPLDGRLRCVRIEEAKQCEDRIIALDGSDLVYRMNPTNGDGYFPQEFVATVLPGILAGLPEKIDGAVAGCRVLPLDGERPTVEFYQERWAPRWMRRICTLLGKPVGLEVDWKRAAGASNSGPQLPRWGLNRVYGALALACLDSSRSKALKQNLKAIELELGSNVINKFARYEGGKLSVGISYYGGDTPGCYEHEIAAALAGQP